MENVVLTKEKLELIRSYNVSPCSKFFKEGETIEFCENTLKENIKNSRRFRRDVMKMGLSCGVFLPIFCLTLLVSIIDPLLMSDPQWEVFMSGLGVIVILSLAFSFKSIVRVGDVYNVFKDDDADFEELVCVAGEYGVDLI